MTAQRESWEIIEDFWRGGNGDPTDSWQPYIDASNEAFADGAGAVIITGRHGVGKTQIFGGVQERADPDYRMLSELETFMPPTDNNPMLELNTYYGNTIAQIDETTAVEEPTMVELWADRIQMAAEQGVRSVLAFPSATYSDRASAAQNMQEALGERGAAFVNIGDVVETHVTEEKAARVLRELGSTSKLINYVNANRPLRTLRMFSGILEGIDHSQELSAPRGSRNPFRRASPQWLEELMGDTLVLGRRGDFVEMGWAGLGDLMQYTDVGFYTQSLTTAASLELYKMLGATPPKPGVNPYDRPYDPYDKN